MFLIARAESALLRAGGRTIIGRAAEMLRRAGSPATAVIASPELDTEALSREVETWIEPCPVMSATDATETLSEARGGEVALIVDASTVYDKRLIELAVAWTEPTRFIGAGGDPPVGLAALSLADVAGALKADDPDFSAAAASEALIDEIPLYYPAIRRELRPFWLPISGRSDLRGARQTLARAAGKGHMEWYVVFFNRPIETFLSTYIAEWRITPNQITAISNVTAYAATALLAFGWLWTALAFVVVTGILDGLDGRQARIQIKTSKVGEWEHVFDAISEISWMLALGWHMSAHLSDTTAVAATIAWLAFYAADNASYTFFRLRRGIMIDEASPIDAAIRFVGARRNTSFAYFAIGLALGVPREGFLAMVGFAGATALAHWIRIAMHLRGPDPRATQAP